MIDAKGNYRAAPQRDYYVRIVLKNCSVLLRKHGKSLDDIMAYVNTLVSVTGERFQITLGGKVVYDTNIGELTS